MRASTVAWFAVGCGLAVAVVAAGNVAVQAVRGEGFFDASSDTTLQAMTPAAKPEHEVFAPHPAGGPAGEPVPIQRPRHVLDAPPVAPPPPVPLAPIVPSSQWEIGQARLPSPQAGVYWNPDDARIPDDSIVVAAVRVYWNPDSAVLPRPDRRKPAVWDPNDARLPSL